MNSVTLPAVIAPALPAEIAERLAQHAHHARGAMAPETERALRKASAAFTAWAADHDHLALPAGVVTVAAYVDALAAAGMKPASIRQAVWGVATMHRAAGLVDPTKAEAVRLALKRMARAAGTRQRQAAPLGDREIQGILATAGNSPPAQRNVTLLLVMSDLLARRSEAVALEVGDIGFAEDGTGTALIRRSKTDQAGAGEVRFLARETVTYLRRWLASAGITTGPLFRTVNKAGRLGPQLTPGDVPRILKALAQGAGLDPSAISGHSCRVGMAQDLVADGAELPEVMQAGRWRSPAMPARYAERMMAGRGAVARFREKRQARG